MVEGGTPAGPRNARERRQVWEAQEIRGAIFGVAVFF